MWHEEGKDGVLLGMKEPEARGSLEETEQTDSPAPEPRNNRSHHQTPSLSERSEEERGRTKGTELCEGARSG